MIVISSHVNRCRVSKYISPFFFRHIKIYMYRFLFQYTRGGHIFHLHITFIKWMLWCIYLTVKLYRCDKWKVPSQACNFLSMAEIPASDTHVFTCFYKQIRVTIYPQLVYSGAVSWCAHKWKAKAKFLYHCLVDQIQVQTTNYIKHKFEWCQWLIADMRPIIRAEAPAKLDPFYQKGLTNRDSI